MNDVGSEDLLLPRPNPEEEDDDEEEISLEDDLLRPLRGIGRYVYMCDTDVLISCTVDQQHESADSARTASAAAFR